MVLDSIETENVHDFRLFINDELMDLESEIKFLKDDKITVKITRDDLYKNSILTLVGFDPNVAIDNTYISEVSIDEPIGEEQILINFNENEEE
jgi:hypothetical protein